MYVVLGAAGNVGSQVVRALRKQNQPVLAVVHSAKSLETVRTVGVEPVVVDLDDSQALRAVFRRARRAFLLNPPGDPSGGSEADELARGTSIAAALQGSGLEKVVLASTYGAQPGESMGDLSTLYALEQQVNASAIPAAINRGAYYFSNLDMLLQPARDGVLPTAFPADLALPMVAAEDLGRAAAERLISAVDDVGVQNIEGPERYSFSDVAAVLERLLGRSVKVETTPREQWEESFQQAGFSPQSARSFARMTAATINGDFPETAWRGNVGLEEYLARRLEN